VIQSSRGQREHPRPSQPRRRDRRAGGARRGDHDHPLRDAGRPARGGPFRAAARGDAAGALAAPAQRRRRRAAPRARRGPRLLAASRGVLDTSALILLPRLSNAAALPTEPLITTVTLAELSVGPLVAADEAERAARLAHLQQAEADFDPLPFDAAAARAFGRVAASLRRRGRKPSARAYDAMIAATALAHDLPVYTANPSDFAGIDGLEVVAVSAD